MPKKLHQRSVDDPFESQIEASYRRSFILLCIGYILLACAGLVYVAWSTPDQIWTDGTWRIWMRLTLLAAAVLLAACFLLWNRTRITNATQIMSAITALIIALGAMMLLSRLLLQPRAPDLVAWGLFDLLALHVIACLTLPWRPRDSVPPFVPLLIIWAVLMIVVPSHLDMFQRCVAALLAPAVLFPGAGLASWRYRKSREQFDHLMLGRRMESIGSELSRARIVHDAMFPRPTDTGHALFEYAYMPLQELGGDYVHLHVCRTTGRVYLTLLDVAGHGLAAALTVNRLFGELERIRAEKWDASPHDVVELLNRYINLTMAPYNLYATGTCIMLDPSTGDLRWVNAGHPPAILRRIDGSVNDLPGTTLLLGAESYAEFETNEKSMQLSPGDTVIAYTDGIFEARDDSGKRFGIDGLRETARFTPPPRDWTRFIMNAVNKHMHGPAQDDMLVVSLQFSSQRVGELGEHAEESAAKINA
jgi:serine phosphatase RsbU (regulator of sigma subunit)